jgi:hypothetical protein
MVVKCCFCDQPTARPIHCTKCNEFACQKCTVVINGVPTCLKCYLENCKPQEKKRMLQILKEKGIVKDDIEAELSYKEKHITQLFYTRYQNIFEWNIKVEGGYHKVTKLELDPLWEKAIRFGFKPEKIPFGEKITIKG